MLEAFGCFGGIVQRNIKLFKTLQQVKKVWLKSSESEGCYLTFCMVDQCGTYFLSYALRIHCRRVFFFFLLNPQMRQMQVKKILAVSSIQVALLI